MQLSVGDQVGNFEILAKIGAGGMGEVYKARDTRIDRLVAIKVVNESFSGRFEREVHAISRLNHPHICTVYDLGPGYLVMELVEGETLASRLERGPLPLDVALRHGADIAEALAAAHAKDIVHRDLKPGNIMLTQEGRIKVLDFGLAKLRDPTRDLDSTLTASGLLLGTPAYMSPEQAAGQPADQRSDVFALGAVLYEMVSGRRPFRGSSQVDVLHAVVHSTVDPVDPPELQWILEKALAKDLAERYESVRELGTDLRRLSRRLTAGEHGRAKLATAATTARSSRGKIIAAAAVGFAVAAILGFLVYLRNPPSTEPFLSPEASIVRLTSHSGTERSPAISPDGRYFAFVSDHDGAPDIWVRGVSGGEPVRVTQDEAAESDVVYAPGGDSLYFTKQGAVWSIGALGGNLRKVIGQGRSPAPSPDGTEVAYVGRDGIYIGTTEGTGSRKLIPASTVAHLAWSPDGAWLAHVEGSLFDAHQIFITPRNGDKKRQVTSFTYGSMGGLAWLPDSKQIVFSRGIDRSQVEGHDLAILSIADGGVRRITLNDSGHFYGLRMSKDGARLVTGRFEYEREVWKVPVTSDPETNGARAVRLLDSSWAPLWIHLWRNALLFNSSASGNRNLWTMPLDGSAPPRQITSERGDITHAALSPDGTRVAYTSFESGSAQIWRRNVDGSGPMQLTRMVRPAFWPVWAPDGRSIVFGSHNGGVPELWKIPITGGEPVPLAQGVGMRCDWSHVNNQLVCSDGGRTLAILDAVTGKVIRSIPWPDSSAALPCWSPDGRQISALRSPIGTGSSIWIIDAATGQARETVRFKQPFPMLFRASWTSDGDFLVVNRNEHTSHVTLFENF